VENRYTVKNIVRSVTTRTLRKQGPTRPRFKQFVAGRRLLRKQSVVLSAQEFEENYKSIMDRVAMGILEVRDAAGDIVFGLKNTAPPAPKTVEEPKATETVEAPKVDAGWQEPVIPEEELKEAKQAVEAGEAKPDELTALPHIGAGRANKLIGEGITDFNAVIDAGEDILMEILGGTFSRDMAEAVVQKAKEKVG
jgi:predicted flap endonuclease-1-like 5' DNA nuclease